MIKILKTDVRYNENTPRYRRMISKYLTSNKFTDSEIIKWQYKTMKPYKKIYTLYLLSPSCFVLYFSMYRNSSLRKFWGDTFFITATEKLSIENCWPCTSLACIERADFSHFSSQKQWRWPLVRLCDSWVVRPKYASGPRQNLHIQRYTIFFGLGTFWSRKSLGCLTRSWNVSIESYQNPCGSYE